MSSRPVAADDHRATIAHFLSVLSGPLGTVVHVGAHTGEEVDAYRRHGARLIVLVEASPASCEVLAQRFGGDEDIEIIHAAATDRVGTERLLLHTDSRGGTESASLLPMKRLGQIVSSMHTERMIDVPATTLDALLERIAVEPEAVGLLVLDVQGAELRVLHGAPRTLSGVRALLTEVALIELYDGAAREEDVEQLLTAVGFTAVDALDYELYEGDRRFPAWGDRLYTRNP
jgi:FkbM family methyltransferase